MFSGAKLRQARQEAGLSQAALAEKVGVSLRAVAYWEAGKREPRGYLMRRIALATGKPLEFFVADEDAE